MGSGGSSSKVTPLHSLEDNSKRPENVTDVTDVTERLSSRIKDLEQQLELKNETFKNTESQLESSRQQVELLRSEVLNLKESLSARESSTASGRALEHIILQLKEELATAHAEMDKMRDNYERRLQRVRSSSAKSQAESALSLFELRDENQRLEKENTLLLEQINKGKEASSQNSCGHMQLIVELSQQLSTSEVELSKAKLVLQELGIESEN